MQQYKPYTDGYGRAWELTPIPHAGGHVVDCLSWVKSAAPGSHPGDYSRAGHGPSAHPIVSPNPTDVITSAPTSTRSSIVSGSGGRSSD